jgi:hypothetical protein
MSKAFEKLIVKRLKPIIAEKHLVPTHKHGQKNYWTIEQVQRITDIMEKTLENKGLCSAVFHDIAQAFDRIWHRGLLHKLRSTLPDHFYQLLKSYLTNGHFGVKHEDSYSKLKFIKAGVPQRNVLELGLCLIYINNVSTTLNSTMATFADDTAVTAVADIA